MEIWKPIAGWETYYEVSSEGRVRSVDRVLRCTNPFGKVAPRRFKGKVLAASVSGNGYRIVTLTAPGRRCYANVHRLVAETFIGPCPDGLEVRHLNGRRKDCRLENLKYGTRSENAMDRHAHGTMRFPRGEMAAMAKLTNEAVRWIRGNVDRMSGRAMARQLGVNHSTVQSVINGTSWSHV